MNHKNNDEFTLEILDIIEKYQNLGSFEISSVLISQAVSMLLATESHIVAMKIILGSVGSGIADHEEHLDLMNLALKNK